MSNRSHLVPKQIQREDGAVATFWVNPGGRSKVPMAVALGMVPVAAVGLAACAPADVDANSPEPSDPSSTSAPVVDPVETEAPEPVETEEPTEIQAGDELSAEDAKTLNESNELAVAYPVGDKFIAVKWGEPTPEPVRIAVQENVKAATPGLGTTTNISEDAGRLKEALAAESQKLGGISVAAVQCGMSYEGDGSVAVPTWAISEPGPVGTYPSREAAVEKINAWVAGQSGNRTYIEINNLGC